MSCYGCVGDATSLKQHQSKPLTTPAMAPYFLYEARKGTQRIFYSFHSPLEEPDLMQINYRHTAAADEMRF